MGWAEQPLPPPDAERQIAAVSSQDSSVPAAVEAADEAGAAMQQDPPQNENRKRDAIEAFGAAEAGVNSGTADEAKPAAKPAKAPRKHTGTPQQSQNLGAASSGATPSSEKRIPKKKNLFADIDFEDELRIAVEERASLSPDALTGMEASLRFVGPETLATKIFGRLSAWQNWIFFRPNATGEVGALTLYGHPQRPTFDWRRT